VEVFDVRCSKKNRVMRKTQMLGQAHLPSSLVRIGQLWTNPAHCIPAVGRQFSGTLSLGWSFIPPDHLKSVSAVRCATLVVAISTHIQSTWPRSTPHELHVSAPFRGESPSRGSLLRRAVARTRRRRRFSMHRGRHVGFREKSTRTDTTSWPLQQIAVMLSR
jgi:hypothetical protein